MGFETMGMDAKPEEPKQESIETTEMDAKPEAPKQESINDPALFDLYRRADDAGRSQRSLEDIKKVAEEISSKLYELGATNLPPESKLGEAYLSASKVKESYQDVEQAQSAMKRIVSLIFESDGFKDASEKWEQDQG